MKKAAFYFIITVLLALGEATMCHSSNEFKKVLNLSGELAKAFIISYSDFLNISDLRQEQKNIEHYYFEISEDDGFILIHYIPKLLPPKKADELNRMALGREIKYWINKESYTIVKRLFYKS